MRKSDVDPYPWEIDVFHAKEAIRQGGEAWLAAYLHDAANGMKLVSDLMDPPVNVAPQLQLPGIREHGAAEEREREEEFVGTAHQLEVAVEGGDTRMVGWYLRELSEVLGLTADTLSNEGHSEWRLRFRRRRRGRPHRQRQSVKHDVGLALGFEKAAGKNLKKPVWELSQKHGISRATIYRMMQQPTARSRKKR